MRKVRLAGGLLPASDMSSGSERSTELQWLGHVLQGEYKQTQSCKAFFWTVL